MDQRIADALDRLGRSIDRLTVTIVQQGYHWESARKGSLAWKHGKKGWGFYITGGADDVRFLDASLTDQAKWVDAIPALCKEIVSVHNKEVLLLEMLEDRIRILAEKGINQ